LTRFVLEASVAVAWAVDRNADPSAELVQQRLQSGIRSIVPTFWQLEVAIALAMVER
jgi:hypothetical protein